MRSRDFDLEFRDRAVKVRSWGVGLLVAAAVLWIWAAKELFIPREPDLQEIVTVLGASIPVSVAGGSLFTIGIVSRRMSAHSQAMRELDKLAASSKD
ncbi:hypothetical protein [Streptomyces sp. NBC_01012]|uniref:hypothetical protein n=1 Tax=Streptomyces sp. NBC_01012 TaxID=2903717 RepID=UPI00386EAA50|nr:hypothetical protein OG623_24950 [Streptomyces sp. NBC_01012]